MISIHVVLKYISWSCTAIVKSNDTSSWTKILIFQNWFFFESLKLAHCFECLSYNLCKIFSNQKWLDSELLIKEIYLEYQYFFLWLYSTCSYSSLLMCLEWWSFSLLDNFDVKLSANRVLIEKFEWTSGHNIYKILNSVRHHTYNYFTDLKYFCHFLTIQILKKIENHYALMIDSF